MDIKKTDVFSGIGVFTIQMIANGIWYAFQKNKIFLTIGIIFAVIISIFIVIIIGLRRKLRVQEEYFDKQIENLGIDSLKKEKDELLESIASLNNRINDVERERDDINQEIDSLEQEIELLKNKCEYYINTASVNRKILYSLKGKLGYFRRRKLPFLDWRKDRNRFWHCLPYVTRNQQKSYSFPERFLWLLRSFRHFGRNVEFLLPLL